ncbi:MAG: DnaJ domain-containing protein [Deltaproteobacteria bacterium]|jgi:DnaJ-class molecular chaperone|nr:DnaJ domain-containing protein [Deltaproteobacteria bacterium]MCW8892703.1 DnaJ domain-containing protein [Deltaproteobacteria bacterium]MCW9049048.1 DnaJ domain-containing protein [Deltaproteobacteria bacterium]
MTYEDLRAALSEFDLPQQVTLKKIRERHRQLVRRYHPDKGASPDNEKIRRVNAAYKILNEYLSGYSFDFSRDVFLEQYPEERVREQFYDVGLWGDKG